MQTCGFGIKRDILVSSPRYVRVMCVSQDPRLLRGVMIFEAANRKIDNDRRGKRADRCSGQGGKWGGAGRVYKRDAQGFTREKKMNPREHVMRR